MIGFGSLNLSRFSTWHGVTGDWQRREASRRGSAAGTARSGDRSQPPSPGAALRPEGAEPEPAARRAPGEAFRRPSVTLPPSPAEPLPLPAAEPVLPLTWERPGAAAQAGGGRRGGGPRGAPTGPARKVSGGGDAAVRGSGCN